MPRVLASQFDEHATSRRHVARDTCRVYVRFNEAAGLARYKKFPECHLLDVTPYYSRFLSVLPILRASCVMQPTSLLVIYISCNTLLSNFKNAFLVKSELISRCLCKREFI